LGTVYSMALVATGVETGIVEVTEHVAVVDLKGVGGPAGSYINITLVVAVKTVCGDGHVVDCLGPVGGVKGGTVALVAPESIVTTGFGTIGVGVAVAGTCSGCGVVAVTTGLVGCGIYLILSIDSYISDGGVVGMGGNAG